LEGTGGEGFPVTLVDRPSSELSDAELLLCVSFIRLIFDGSSSGELLILLLRAFFVLDSTGLEAPQSSE
jgi:hypothetical protein